VIKAKEWPALMGRKWLALNWRFTLRIEGGERGNGHGMRCSARGSGSMAGEAGEAAQGQRRRCLLFSARGGRRKSIGPGGPKGRVGRWVVGPTGPEAERNSFLE
jgi:hypothetical protein